MRDAYYFNRDSEALTGKVPVQVFFHGDGDFDLIKGRANGELQSFLRDVNAGALQQLTKKVELSPLAYVVMQHSFGVTRVHVHARRTGSRLSQFFGGILISPRVHSDEAAFEFNSAPGWEEVVAIRTSGRTPGNPGRPAVPGTVETDQTNWLVVQIHPTKSLEDEPIKKGAVKIYRIKDPLFGEIAEINAENLYLVSTKAPGTDFFVCGKRMASVPPLPVELQRFTHGAIFIESTSWQVRYPVRLRTYNLQVPSFEDAARSQAIIIVATVNELWAINTREHPDGGTASWQQLANVEMPGDYPLDFRPALYGTEFSETRIGNVTTITCSGTNGAGECSGFTVQITQAPGAPFPTLSGHLNLVDSGFVKRQDSTTEYAVNGTYQSLPQAEHIDIWDFCYGTYTGGETDWEPPTYLQRSVGYRAVGFYEAHTVSYHFRRGDSAIEPDEFLGGLRPRHHLYEHTHEEIGHTRVDNFLGYHLRLKGTNWIEEYNAIGLSHSDFDPFVVHGTNPLFLSNEFDIELGTTEFDLYYSPHSFYDVAKARISYDFVWEGSGLYRPWNDGLTIEVGVDVPAEWEGYKYANALYPPTEHVISDPDNALYDSSIYKHFLQSATDPPFEIVGGTPDPGTPYVYDSEPICAYPKRAAIFEGEEQWEVTAEVTGGVLGSNTFVANSTRGGTVRADEYLARKLPTNVADYPEPEAAVELLEDATAIPTDSGPILEEHNNYGARDFHGNALAWRATLVVSGLWAMTDTFDAEETKIYDRTAGDVEHTCSVSGSVKLLKPDGLPLYDIPDAFLLAPYIAAPQTQVSRVVNRARPLLQWPLYRNDPEDPELDRADIRHSEGNITTPGYPFFGYEDGSNHLTTPKLQVGYWSRSPDGAEFDPRFPELRVEPVLTDSCVSVSGTESAGLLPDGSVRDGLYPELLIPGSDQLNMASSQIYRDIRTGGFLTQLVFRFYGASARYFDSFIGNASGVTRFRPIFEEWLALGTGSSPPGSKMLLVKLDVGQGEETPLNMDPQRVSLL